MIYLGGIDFIKCGIDINVAGKDYLCVEVSELEEKLKEWRLSKEEEVTNRAEKLLRELADEDNVIIARLSEEIKEPRRTELLKELMPWRYKE